MTKSRFTKQVKQLFLSMGLNVIEPAVDCDIDKPDLVAIYTDTFKYYIIEVISDECITEPFPRLTYDKSNIHYNEYCKKLFKGSDYLASIAYAILADLSNGLESFNDELIKRYQLTDMACYATIAVSDKHLKAVDKVLDFLDIEHKSLDVIDKFHLMLISKEDTAKLLEKHRFRTYLRLNQ